MSDTYDPYRNAVRQSLGEKAQAKRKKFFIEQHQKEKSKSFFQKKIYVTDFIDLPKGLVNIIIFILFIFIPYLIGITFTFIFLAKLSFHTYQSFQNPFAFSWVMGYELLATLLLLAIIKSALTFK